MIFADNAPALWKRGLPVIPLYEREKKPIPTGWSAYKDTMPALEMQTFWVGMHPNSNIGLPLGPQAGLIAIDLDTDDPKALQVLETILPPSPWKRVGAKGAVWLYRFGGQRTARIKTSDGKVLCEILSAGTQVVLPPSIHPTTQKPYVANCELLDVLGDVPSLPEDIEVVLRKAFIAAGFELSTHGNTKISEWTPAGARDSQMVSHAGILARAITRGERSVQSALSEMAHWVETYTEKVAGDDLDPEKARLKVIEFLVKDVTQAKKVLPRGWDEGLSDDEKAKMHALFGGSGADVEEWSFDQLKSYITDEFKKHADESAGRHNAADVAIAKVAAKSLSPTQEGAILKHIAGLDRSLSVPDMRKTLAKLKKGPIEGISHAEIAGELVAEIEKFGEVRFDKSLFWQWKGACWEPVEDYEVQVVIARDFSHMQAARRYSDIVGIMKVASALKRKSLGTEKVTGINFANGYLTSDMQLLPHDPKYGCTYVLPYRYLPELEGSACHRFQTFLMDCWGHSSDFEQKTQALKELMAATLFGVAPKLQRAACPYGVANSGKTTLMRTVLGLVPESATCAVPPHEWKDRWQPTAMFEKLINFCGELSETELIEGDVFKMIIDGGKIKGEYKGKDQFYFHPGCAHWFCGNHLPKTKDTSDGFNRRWLFLEFDKAVPAGEVVLDLAADILSEEREAIVAWCAPAIKDLLRRGSYTLPPSHFELEKFMAETTDPLRSFFDSEWVRRGKGETGDMALYQHFSNYCATIRVKHVSFPLFRTQARHLATSRGIRVVTEPTGAQRFEGIGLNK